MVAFATGSPQVDFIAFVSVHDDEPPALNYLPYFNQSNMSQHDHKINNVQVIVNREQTM
jgi:hypothetical protein